MLPLLAFEVMSTTFLVVVVPVWVSLIVSSTRTFDDHPGAFRSSTGLGGGAAAGGGGAARPCEDCGLTTAAPGVGDCLDEADRRAMPGAAIITVQRTARADSRDMRLLCGDSQLEASRSAIAADGPDHQWCGRRNRCYLQLSDRQPRRLDRRHPEVGNRFERRHGPLAPGRGLGVRVRCRIKAADRRAVQIG